MRQRIRLGFHHRDEPDMNMNVNEDIQALIQRVRLLDEEALVRKCRSFGHSVRKGTPLELLQQLVIAGALEAYGIRLANATKAEIKRRLNPPSDILDGII